MRILVSSRMQIAQLIIKTQKDNPDDKIITVSITDPKSELVDLPLEESNILRLSFHDLDKDYPFSGLSTILFNQDMAQRIKFFVEQKFCDNMILLTHCEAGISRSAGVAGALAKHFLGNDSKFFKYPYLPNRHVYRTLLNLLSGQENPIPNVILNGDFEENNIFG